MAELISVPLKKSSDVDIVKPLKNLIQSTYSTSDSSEDYTEALNELSRLRSNAIWKVFEKSSLDTLYSYYDQLVSLGSKIPPHEVQIPFKWKDAFDKGSIFGGRMSLTVSSLEYERVCVLFNIAAMQSCVAAQQALDSEEELKTAAKLLQQSGGAFAHLKATVTTAVHRDTTPDLNPDTLGALSQLMLAQAQEVIAYKCIRDEMKASAVAKVCAAGEEMYAEAARGLARDPLRALLDRDWSSRVQAKQMALRGLAQYYQSAVCRANGAFGEEIARLQVCAEQLRGATGGSSGAGAGAGVVQETARRATRRLQEATRDNDFIYHERVPEPAQLEPVTRAPLAKPLPPPDRWAPDRADPFARLMPLAVQQALQASAARRGEMVAAEVGRLRDATQLLNSALASLNLPACVEGEVAGEGEGEGSLPPSLRDKAAEVRSAGGVRELRRLMDELPELLQRNREVLDETERMLREEREADEALRAQFGLRWTRTESRLLTEAFRANAAKYAQIVDNAVRADAIVRQKFRQHEEDMALLSGGEGEMSAALPDGGGSGSGAGGGGSGAEAARRLRELLREVDDLKAERDAIEAELKDATVDLRDRFLAALAESGAVDEPALSAGALGAALGDLRRRAAGSLERQERLVELAREARGALREARGPPGDRERALCRLAAAYDAYTELAGNLREGVKFYDDLTQLLVAFQNKVSDFCFARKTEKEELLKDLTQEASRDLPAAPPRASRDEPTPAPSAAPRKEAPPRPPPPAAPQAPPTQAPPAQAPAAAPLPYPTQPLGMPLPYAASGAPYAYYAPPPMPALYNPYATLPYPHHARAAPAGPAYQPYQHPPPGYNPYQQHQ